MESRSRHVSVPISRPADVAYDYAADPSNLLEWAPGLATSVENVDGQWVLESPMGRVGFAFVPRNDLGVLDHTVTMPSGEVFYNPMRIVPDEDTCEVVFTVRRQDGMSDEEFERDCAAVSADLAALKRVIEGR